MRIQPIDANQQTSFNALKVRRLNVKPRLEKRLSPEQQQERNYVQAIMFALAFIAAAFTKYFIDVANGRHKELVRVEETANKLDSVDENAYFLK